MEKLRKSAQRFEEESDPEDWFGNHRNVKIRGAAVDSPSNSRQERERERDRRKERDKERWRERERERERERRERDREMDRARGRERESSRERDRGRERERGREQERQQERDRDQERDHGRDQPSSGARGGGGGKVKISFPKSFGEGRHLLPPPPPDLPTRPAAHSRPSLLDRIGDRLTDDPPPSRNHPRGSRQNVNGGMSLSIKGAGQQQSRDNNHKSSRLARGNSGPQYRGGYTR